MGVNADRGAAISEFERAHIFRSFRRSILALLLAMVVALPLFLPFWVLAA